MCSFDDHYQSHHNIFGLLLCEGVVTKDFLQSKCVEGRSAPIHILIVLESEHYLDKTFAIVICK